MRPSLKRGASAALSATLIGGMLVAAATTATAAHHELLSTESTQWKYLDDGVDPAGDGDVFSWVLPEFDDSGWPEARGSFGSLRGEHTDVGGNAVHTHLQQYYPGTQDNIEAFFFRTTFEIAPADLERIVTLTGTARFDDALSVWVNGDKVAGYFDEDFDPARGNLQYLGVGNGSPVVRQFEIAPELLQAGENTIAIALYQDRRTSSDLYFDLEQLVADTGPVELEPGQLIGTGATLWRYHDRDEDPAGDGELFSWTRADYDDADWAVERAPFGALRGQHADVSGLPVRTLLQQYKPGSSTNIEAFFFRSEFTLNAAQLEETALLRGLVRVDDALAVWVNGHKVAGVLDQGFDPARGNMQYLGASNGAPISASVTVEPQHLVEGTNTIAVAVYQDRDTSSDIYFDFEDLRIVSVHDPVEVTDVILNVGADETVRNVAWYTSLPTTGRVEWAPTSSMTGEEFPAEAARSAAPVDSGETHDGRAYHHATMGGLEENTSYVYRVGGASGWSETHEFTTGAFGPGDFAFLVAGDPQIGSSGNVASDTAGWVNTLSVAEEMFPEAEMIHSVGDQVERAANENEYVGFLTPDQLRSMPVSTINGNHDVGSTAYRTHFFMPNLDESYGAASNPNHSGGNHWFLYKDMLVIGLNSNNMNIATHDEYIEKVLAEHGHRASWHVVSFHHSVFSVANHSINSGIVAFRNGLSPVLSKHEIDLVLMGHDHSYTRTTLMDGRTPIQVEDAAEVSPEPGQTLYVTANSASGSKYYSIRTPEAIAAADPNGSDYVEVSWQERVPSFTNIEVSGDQMTITSYRTDTREAFDSVVLNRAGADEETEEPPVAEPSEEHLVEELRGLIEVPAEIERGASVTVGVGSEWAGEEVTAYLFSEPVLVGSAVVGGAGTAVFTVPVDAPLGAHSFAVYAADGSVIGWAETSVMAAVGGGDDTGDGDDDGTGGESGTGTGTDTGDGSGAGNGGTAAGTGAGELSDTGADALSIIAAAALLLMVGLATVAFSRSSGRADADEDAWLHGVDDEVVPL